MVSVELISDMSLRMDRERRLVRGTVSTAVVCGSRGKLERRTQNPHHQRRPEGMLKHLLPRLTIEIYSRLHTCVISF